MRHLQWITEQMNKGKTWDDLKNISEDEFFDLREIHGIIPFSIKTLSDWKKVVEEREKVYAEVEKQRVYLSTHLWIWIFLTV